jgi:murein DD-endopeptidase MepM/ murein hydrolase activator NlpD
MRRREWSSGRWAWLTAALVAWACVGLAPGWRPLSQSRAPSAVAQEHAAEPVLARPRPGPETRVLPLFAKPFVGEYPVAQFFDHDLPFQFRDDNGYQLTWWGERTAGLDGHEAYDWELPEGTPLLAVADGVVLRAGESEPIPCPLFGRPVRELAVLLSHPWPGAENDLALVSGYAHLSRVDVEPGQPVRQGQPIGLSGNTGCSTQAHLHFNVRRYEPRAGRAILLDPYGWESPESDPWAEHPEGTPSVWLWQPDHAPAIYREVSLPPNPFAGNRAPVAITRFRWMGWRDDQHPNNEVVELTLDGRFAPSGEVDLGGYALRNDRGDAFTFPAGFSIREGAPVRVYTGAGTATATTLYWDRDAGVWSNGGDCARLVWPDGQVDYLLGPGTCR